MSVFDSWPAVREFEAQLQGATVLICAARSSRILRFCCSLAQSISMLVAVESFGFGRPSIVIEDLRLRMGCLHIDNIDRLSLHRLLVAKLVVFSPWTYRSLKACLPYSSSPCTGKCLRKGTR